MLIFKIHSLAREENISAAVWYEEQQAGLGERYSIAVEQSLGQIRNNPEHFGHIRGGYRQANVKGFPYIIVYEFFPKRNSIHISAIFHASRNPRKKFRKEE